MTDANPSDDLMEKIAAYAVVRQNREEAEAAEILEKLSERERILVKEAAVAAYVTAIMDSGVGHKFRVPRDRETLLRTLATVNNFPDLYPTLSDYTEDDDND